VQGQLDLLLPQAQAVHLQPVEPLGQHRIAEHHRHAGASSWRPVPSPGKVDLFLPRMRVSLLLATLLLAVLPGGARAASTAGATDWQRYRDFYLGAGRPYLLSFCAIWRDANAQGHSLWEPGLLRRLNAPLSREGFSEPEIDAITAGQVVAMSQACPGIR
jgi:hypothetical protein